ncbi:MAG TPA: universal stress protein [Micromonosporaceae bacterium]
MTSIAGAPVVVGVDGSSSALRAVRAATREAGYRHRPLRVVHAFVWPYLNAPVGPAPGAPPGAGLRDEADRVVREAVRVAAEVDPAVPVSAEVVTGAPGPVMVGEAQRAALVVLGDRGLGGFTGLLVGSVAVHVAAHGTAPVLIVRGDEDGTGDVVVGVDDSAVSDHAIGFAFEEASWRHARLVAVHAWTRPVSVAPGDMLPVVYDPDEVADEERRVLAEALSGWRDKFPDVDVEERVVRGRPSAVLIGAAHPARLLVVGARGRGGFAGLLLGSVSQAVLHHADCPVAIVRQPRRPG